MPPKFTLSSLKRFIPEKQEVPKEFDAIGATFKIVRKLIKPTLVLIVVLSLAKTFSLNRRYETMNHGLYLAEKEELKIKQNSEKL